MPGAQRDYVASATAVWNMCIVQRDRIILGDAPAWFERMLAGRAARFFAAVGAVLLMAGSVKLMVLIAGVWEFGSELHQILLFAAIIVSSLIGGLGPGCARCGLGKVAQPQGRSEARFRALVLIAGLDTPKSPCVMVFTDDAS